MSLSVILLASCSENNTKKQSKQSQVTHLAKVKIKGMVCVMGCGAEIRKHLNATNAVRSCKFDFEDGREINTASIQYDPSKISENKIKAIIEKINNKQFSVVGSSSQQIEANVHSEVTESCNKSYAPISIKKSTWEFPNLLDLLFSFML